MQKKTNKMRLFQKDNNCGPEPLLWIGAILAMSVVLLLFECLGLHRLLGLSGNVFWKSMVAPLALQIDQNFINLYISQISTTFLVTAFMSFLGDKDTAIYWTSAMEFKLVHPRGSGLKDFTLYSFLTLGISVVAILMKAKLCFAVSFFLNIYFLGIVTWRILRTFYDRDEIVKEIENDFKKMSVENQKVKLLQMEQKMVRAAGENNVEYLLECLEFLNEIVSADAFKQLQKERQQVNEWIGILENSVKKCKRYLENDPKTLTAALALGKEVVEDVAPCAQKLKDKFVELYETYRLTNVFTREKIETLSCWKIPEFGQCATVQQANEQIALLQSRVEKMRDVSKNPLWAHIGRLMPMKVDDEELHKRLLDCIRVIPERFAQMQFACMQKFRERVGECDWATDDFATQQKKRSQHLQAFLRHGEDLSTYSAPPELDIDMRERVVYLLRKNICEADLSEEVVMQGLTLLIDLKLIELKQMLSQEVKYALQGETLNFRMFFADLVYMLREACDSHFSPVAYVRAIVCLCELIEEGIWEIYLSEHPDSAKNKSDVLKQIFKNVILFNQEETKALFVCVCSTTALMNDYMNIYDVLIYACKAQGDMSKELKEDICEIVNQSLVLGDDRGYILQFLE